ncbi:unnamed protein product [Rangifer tarandus platyrhynchus]|uniref:Uncharacterized protein n=1 Tax=Rangifer tarandus platyrhynchus TaxID=3082113 RepID=A0ABN8Z1N5_RANTA|nr:unnamed protein product [Rangifer tarandus platyrhynchus]
MRLPGGPRPPSLRHAPEPLPWDTPSAAQGGAASPSDPTRPWNKGREAPAAPETVPQGSRPPTSQQPRSSPFTPRPQPSAAEPWLVSGLLVYTGRISVKRPPPPCANIFDWTMAKSSQTLR